ncbi:MAG: peptide deformylase [Epsilonproteobacteria bacterium]|nr:MAG: peptide deformylase [Campylobacterota bacterium]RLA67570.1 MAG: peptide deformylase [Campylobacterota bacterium]
MNFLEDYQLAGNEIEIFKYPNPVLKKVADPVTEFNDELRSLVKDMLYTMYQAPGLGLAAPQVGKSLRFFVMDTDYLREEISDAQGNESYKLSEFNPKVIINPLFKDHEGQILYEEGCLSIPGIFENVKRAEKVTVEYQDMWGKKHTELAEGVFSVCLQHENDHLDGIVFLERLSLLKKNFLRKKFLKAQAMA